MKPPRRVLVIARHFWPTTTDHSLQLYHWLQAIRQEGAQPSVLTPKWHPTWPSRLVCDYVPVHRIDHPPTHPLRSGRYSKQLAIWLDEHLGDFDMVYCDANCHLEAATVLTSTRNTSCPPLVLHYEARFQREVGPHGQETKKPLPTPAPVLDVCRRASQIVVPDAASHQQLLAAGVVGPTITRATMTVAAVYHRSAETRRSARRILAEINHDFFCRNQDRVIVCPGELTREWNIENMIHSLATVAEQNRCLRVWVLGDSRERGPIYEALRHDGLHRIAFMPGVFADYEQIFMAADLCVFPAPSVGMQWLLPTCLASSLPVLVSDSPEAQLLLQPSCNNLAYDAADPASLRSRVEAWLRDPQVLQTSVRHVRQSNWSDAPRLSLSDLSRSFAARA